MRRLGRGCAGRLARVEGRGSARKEGRYVMAWEFVSGKQSSEYAAGG